MSRRSARSGIPSPIASVVRGAIRRASMHENVSYFSDLRVGRGCVIGAPHALQIGKGVSIGPHTVIQVNGQVGDYALIGMGVQIVGRVDHATDEVGVPIRDSLWVAERAATHRDSVEIGPDVWIGAGAVILSGIAIGAGAVVAAGAVVVSDVAPFSIVGGNPARQIAVRMPARADQIRHLDILHTLIKENQAPKPKQSTGSVWRLRRRAPNVSERSVS